MKCRICRLDLYKLKTRQKLKIEQIVRTELSINENTERIQTETILNLLDISEIFWIIKIFEIIRH